MKTLIAIAAVLALTAFAPTTQNQVTLIVWTSCTNQGQLDVWVDDRLVGTLTGYYTAPPKAGAKAAITMAINPGSHRIYGQNKARTRKWGPYTFTVPKNGTTYNLRCN